jgi:hypothetical protein
MTALDVAVVEWLNRVDPRAADALYKPVADAGLAAALAKLRGWFARRTRRA